MNKQILLLLSIALLLSFFSFSVSAYATELNLVTTNLTEFNTGLPTITTNISGNCSNYLANLTINGVLVKTISTVQNNTNTNITATTSTSAGAYLYNVTFYNSTCFDGSNTTNSDTLEINAQPSISSVSGNGGAFLKGKVITWTNVWVDRNSTSVDSVKFYACKTDAFTVAGCTGGQWGASSLEIDNSTTVTYTIVVSDPAGTKNAYIYAIDDNNYSSSSTQANFVISKPYDEEQGVSVTTTGQPQAEAMSSKAWMIGIIIAIILVIAIAIRRN
ncbi:MAG TPA: hypothetical protein VGB37_14570 [Candidatus Lokiarchaeia archaeon]